jgi:two-component system cell cycle response regulator CpdR
MIANRNPVSESEELELIDDSDAEVPWVECEFSHQQAVVRGKRILLVDDEEPLRELVRMMLQLDGHQVTEASNGAEALSLFTMGGFDLVITDFEMPVMEGNELAARIKLLDPSLPILMITGSEWARLGVENPVDALLTKPLTVPDLQDALGKLSLARPNPARSTAVLA